jgi:hypothetical protein
VGPIGSNTVPNCYPAHPGPDFHYRARVAVPQRKGLSELALDCRNRGSDAVCAGLLQDLADLIWLPLGLLHKVRTAEVHEHAFSARRHHGGSGTHDETGAGHTRGRYVEEIQYDRSRGAGRSASYSPAAIGVGNAGNL